MGKTRFLKSISVICILLISFTTISGCTSVPIQTEKKKISILYSSVSDFKQDYGGALSSKFDDLDIQIIEYESVLGEGIWNNFEYVPKTGENWNAFAFVRLIQEKKPDIVYFPVSLYPALLKENLLKDVTEFLDDVKYAEMDRPMMDYFKSMGGGRVYFVSDSLAAEAIYYNKDIFNQYGISEPHDQMSWEEVLKLSNLFTMRGKAEHVIGLHTTNYSNVDLLLNIGESNGLKWYDTYNQKILFSSPEWEKVVKQLLEKYKAETGAQLDNKPIQELFAKGRIAMVLDTYRLRDELAKYGSSINWGVVTAPSIKGELNASRSVTFQQLNGIYTNTSDSQEAKEVWAYLNSKELAAVKHNSNYFKFTLPIRLELIKDTEERNLAVFYKLTPQLSSEAIEARLPLQAENASKQYLDSQIQQIFTGYLKPEDALPKWDLELPGIIKTWK